MKLQGMLRAMIKVSRPMYTLQEEIIVTPSEQSTWKPFRGKIIERRHLLHKGWWYRVADFSPANASLWVPEANLEQQAAAV